jgi:hypothetical protein
LLAVLFLGLVLVGFLGVNRFRTGRDWACRANSIEKSLLPFGFRALPVAVQEQLAAKVAETVGSEEDVISAMRSMYVKSAYDSLEASTKRRLTDSLAKLPFEGPRPVLDTSSGSIVIKNQDEMLADDLALTEGAFRAAALSDDATTTVDSETIDEFAHASSCTKRVK